MTELFTEIWKDIEGYDGKYQISNFGAVRDTTRHNRIMPQFVTDKMTRVVDLVRGQDKQTFEVAQLIATYFNIEAKAEPKPKAKRKSKEVK